MSLYLGLLIVGLTGVQSRGHEEVSVFFLLEIVYIISCLTAPPPPPPYHTTHTHTKAGGWRTKETQDMSMIVGDNFGHITIAISGN